MSYHALSTQFFERQEVQRKYTRWLIAGFIAAILLVVVVINLVVLIGLGGNPMHVVRTAPSMIFWISAVVLVTIGLACWHKASEMRWRFRSGAPALGEHRRRNGHRRADPQTADLCVARRGSDQRLRRGTFTG
jgi:hypothetical protein